MNRLGSAPTSLIVVGRPQQFLNVCIHDPEAHIPVELLTPLIQNETWTTFDVHLIGVLVVSSQSGKCSSIVNAFLDGFYINAKRVGQIALNIPTGDLAAIPEKRTTECPGRLIED